MNNKAQINVGTILIIAIGIIVALVLMQGISPQMGQATNTLVMNNVTFTAPAIGSCIDLRGQELLSTPVVKNATVVDAVVPTTNYTITEAISSVDGLKRIKYCTVGAEGVGAKNISYTYGPEGYIEDSGSRSVASLIWVFAALAVLMFVLWPVLKEKFGY